MATLTEVYTRRRVVLVHREEPVLDVLDSPDDDEFEALDADGRFMLKLPLGNSMIGPWRVVERRETRDDWGLPVLLVTITRP